MKLESNLRNHGGALHAAPVLDIVLLLLVFFLLGSKFVLRSGISVELPFAGSTLPPVEQSHVITVSAGAVPVIYFNEDRITLRDLPVELEKRAGGHRNVILKADRLASYGVVMEISDMILSHEYELAVATSPQRHTP
jgi:biopolymer transport protein ExbD